MAALVLRPIGTLSMIGLMLHGAMGRPGESAGVERFEFEHLVARPTLPQGHSGVKVAFDGEVTKMRAPLELRVLANPFVWSSHSATLPQRRPVSAPKGRRLSVLLQMSDTHFGTEQGVVGGALGALAHQQRPDVVVLSGDITQRTRPVQFRAECSLVDLPEALVLAVPGNHDTPLFHLWARPTDCAGMRPQCRFGLKPAPTSSSALTSTSPPSCHCKAWRVRCGLCSRARPYRSQ